MKPGVIWNNIKRRFREFDDSYHSLLIALIGPMVDYASTVWAPSVYYWAGFKEQTEQSAQDDTCVAMSLIEKVMSSARGLKNSRRRHKLQVIGTSLHYTNSYKLYCKLNEAVIN
uniref:Uncharacterized protein n=1 Tax=Glossina austeni TaxID=7395 RepID=A0A1A9VLB5_GLOAU